MYIFLDAAVQPHSLVIYKWCKATPDNCDAARHAHPRPCFTPEFIGGHRVITREHRSSWVGT